MSGKRFFILFKEKFLFKLFFITIIFDNFEVEIIIIKSLDKLYFLLLSKQGKYL